VSVGLLTTEGNPTRAAQGWAKGNGIEVAQATE